MKRELVAALVAASIAGPATAAPQFPARPTWQDVKARVADWQTFIRIAKCEQPGRGAYGVKWATPPGWRFQGGLGFAASTWDGWRPRHYPSDAGLATPQMQILVADAVRDSVGLSAWGCA